MQKLTEDDIAYLKHLLGKITSGPYKIRKSLSGDHELNKVGSPNDYFLTCDDDGNLADIEFWVAAQKYIPVLLEMIKGA